MKQYHWDEYYERFFDWSESTRNRYASAIVSFGDAEEVFEVLLEISMGDEACASRLLKRALDAGVRFTPEQILELSSIADQPTISQMSSSAKGTFTLEQAEEIHGIVDETAYQAVMQATTSHTHMLSWDTYYRGFYNWDSQTRIQYARKLTSFGTADEVAEVLHEIGYDSQDAASALLKNALDAGVRFSAIHVINLAHTVDQPMLTKMADMVETLFTKEQLEAVEGSIDNKTFRTLAKRAGISFTSEYEQEPAPKQGFRLRFWGFIALYKLLQSHSANSRTNRCNGDCAHCPPHYGYRYGRWYYGHSHVYGCELGGNKGDGAL